MQYRDGSPIKVGHVVTDIHGPERYIVLGGDADADFVKLLLIATIIKKDSPSCGQTIINGFTRRVPAMDLTHIGSARINIVDDDPMV